MKCFCSLRQSTREKENTRIFHSSPQVSKIPIFVKSKVYFQSHEHNGYSIFTFLVTCILNIQGGTDSECTSPASHVYQNASIDTYKMKFLYRSKCKIELLFVICGAYTNISFSQSALQTPPWSSSRFYGILHTILNCKFFQILSNT